MMLLLLTQINPVQIIQQTINSHVWNGMLLMQEPAVSAAAAAVAAAAAAAAEGKRLKTTNAKKQTNKWKKSFKKEIKY